MASVEFETGTLMRLIYTSRATLPEAKEEFAGTLQSILRASRRNNRRRDLTGVLLFDGTTFLQAVEGTLENIERLYETIACDQRHEDLEIIDLARTDARKYPTWRMAFLNASDDAHPELSRFMKRPADQGPARLVSFLSDVTRTLASEQAEVVEQAEWVDEREAVAA